MVSGCFGESESDPQDSRDDATQESLRKAYATLEAAAEDVPNARLPRAAKGEVELVERGETYETSRPKNLGLPGYFFEQGIALGLALIDDPIDRGVVLSGMEFTNAPGSIELIIPKELRRASAGELLNGGATFAAISPSGEIYCIREADVGVEPCPAPELPGEPRASEESPDQR
jgi:hypothetical protein